MRLSLFDPENIKVRRGPPLPPPIYRQSVDDPDSINTSEMSIARRMFEAIRGITDPEVTRTQAEVRGINARNRRRYEEQLRRFRRAYPNAPYRDDNPWFQRPGP